jgi:hypothetical protein
VQTDAKFEQEKKKMTLAQHDFKSGQMIQIRDGYAIYFSMLQTMVQNYSAPGLEVDCQIIICKQYDVMRSFEDAQTSLKQYNQSVKLDVIDLTDGNDDADTTPSGAKRDSAAVTLFCDDRNGSAERKESTDERSGSGKKKASAEKKQSSETSAMTTENNNEGVQINAKTKAARQRKLRSPKRNGAAWKK